MWQTWGPTPIWGHEIVKLQKLLGLESCEAPGTGFALMLRPEELLSQLSFGGFYELCHYVRRV